jgi:tRNA-specific 2-thiouridylase
MELVTAEKKDSQGLCFIGKVRLPEFCNKKLQQEGSIIQIEKTMRYIPMKGSTEKALALASNKIAYTQIWGRWLETSRRSLFHDWSTKRTECGGNKDPLFIIATNVETNTIYTV